MNKKLVVFVLSLLFVTVAFVGMVSSQSPIFTMSYSTGNRLTIPTPLHTSGILNDPSSSHSTNSVTYTCLQQGGWGVVYLSIPYHGASYQQNDGSPILYSVKATNSTSTSFIPADVQAGTANYLAFKQVAYGQSITFELYVVQFNNPYYYDPSIHYQIPVNVSFATDYGQPWTYVSAIQTFVGNEYFKNITSGQASFCYPTNNITNASSFFQPNMSWLTYWNTTTNSFVFRYSDRGTDFPINFSTGLIMFTSTNSTLSLGSDLQVSVNYQIPAGISLRGNPMNQNMTISQMLENSTSVMWAAHQNTTSGLFELFYPSDLTHSTNFTVGPTDICWFRASANDTIEFGAIPLT